MTFEMAIEDTKEQIDPQLRRGFGRSHDWARAEPVWVRAHVRQCPDSLVQDRVIDQI